jgi:hypothetical protein
VRGFACAGVRAVRGWHSAGVAPVGLPNHVAQLRMTKRRKCFSLYAFPTDFKVSPAHQRNNTAEEGQYAYEVRSTDTRLVLYYHLLNSAFQHDISSKPSCLVTARLFAQLC